MTDEEFLEREMITTIDQLKLVKGKTDLDNFKIKTIVEVLKVFVAYIHAIHLGKETTDGPQERLPEGSKEG